MSHNFMNNHRYIKQAKFILRKKLEGNKILTIFPEVGLLIIHFLSIVLGVFVLFFSLIFFPNVIVVQV